MFSEVSVSHSVHGWGDRGWEDPSGGRHLVAATAAFGTHPTGMHSCFVDFFHA